MAMFSVLIVLVVVRQLYMSLSKFIELDTEKG